MKRRRLLRHLADHGCVVVKEGGEHTWVRNNTTQSRSVVPRHREIKPGTVRAICKQLGIPAPAE
jgi:mRNA interferase HicA